MDKFYSLGFDIGIGSVGWAVLENNPVTEQPQKILKLGVRTFSPNEVDKTGESTAKSRRETRGIHRRRRRKAFRFERMKKAIFQCLKVNTDKDLAHLLNVDIYKLRFEALDKRLTDAELAKIILNLLKRRGFKSNRKAISSGEEGQLLSAVNENREFLNNNYYRTIGEAIYKDEKFKSENCGKIIYDVRNHNGSYKNSFLRADIENELKIILDRQKELGNLNISEEFKNRVLEIFNNQREFDEGPDQRQSPYSAMFKVGNCTFYNQEPRAPKASYTFELFDSLSKINSLKISGEPLSLEQKQEIVNLLKTKEKITYSNLRKLYSISLTKTFNLCRYSLGKTKTDKELSDEEFIKKCEDKDFVSLKNSGKILKTLGYECFEGNENLIDEIALMLSVCKSDKRIDEYINSSKVLSVLSKEQIENIKEKLNFDKFGSLSFKAMREIIPFLLEGKRYDEACKSAGFNHSSFEQKKIKFLRGEVIDERLQDITSNVVKRAVNQTLRILNEIIKEYGSPQFLTIELSRDLSRMPNERKKVQKSQEENYKNNERILEQIKENFGIIKPSYTDLLKFKLYSEQNGKCMYSGKPIEIERLFEPNYTQIDHILPLSRSMNDSFNNKVLVLTTENQNKGNKTPYEWIGSNETKWNGIVQRANLLSNKEKSRFLLKQNYSEQEQEGFIERNINDTRYMSRLLLEIFDKYLLMAPSKKYKKVVRSVNGSVTNYLRKCWGINKIREDGDIHHCIDAAVIATSTFGQIQKITKFNKFKEKFENHGNNLFINKETGEVISEEEKQEFQTEEIKNKLAKFLPEPYEGFVKELKIRSAVHYIDFSFSDEEKMELLKLGYTDEEVEKIRPVFVSRMKLVKPTGAIHKETMMSAREYNETGNLIKTVQISNLKLSNVPEKEKIKDDMHPEMSIENYYRPKYDRLLYLKLKNYLFEYDKIPETLVFHKPKSDGTDGPVVKKVKVYEKCSNCVITSHGAAENDRMFRVDVFEKDNKYYLCPIYKSDVYKKKLPNKAININKPWITIDKSFNFMFSLYQNDLIKVTNNKDIVLNKSKNSEKSNKPDKIVSKDFLLYYNGTGISGASFTLFSNDRCYKIDSLGVKTLNSLEKYYVDIMGNIYKAPKEERKKL